MNNTIIATDNAQLADDGNSFLDGTAQFLTYGVASSLTSASVGIWNTVKAGANMFGADLSMTDEVGAVRSTFGRDAANYYAENKVSADFGGLLISGVATGIGAIHALRAWQSRGIVMDGYKAATGLANPDIILGSAQVQAYRAAVSSRVSYSWTNKELWGASRVASVQNLKEAAAAEGLFLLTNNQNALLNPEHLDYIDSSINALKEGWMFAAGGAAFGAGLDMLRIKGYAARSFREANETGVAQDLRLVAKELQARTGTFGDKLSEVAQLRQALATDDRFLATTPQQQFALRKAEEQISLLRNDLITDANIAGRGGVVAMQQIMDVTDTSKMMQHLGNLVRVERPTLDTFERAAIAYERLGSTNLATPQLRQALADTDTQVLQAALQELHNVNRARVRGNTAVLSQFNNRLRGRYGHKVMDELWLLARENSNLFGLTPARIAAIESGIDATRKTPKAMMQINQGLFAADTGINLAGTRIHPDYALDLMEVLAETATRFGVASDSYLLSAKYPQLSKLLSKHKVGAIDPFSTNTAYYNTRTGLISATALPRAQDIGEVSIKDGLINIAGVRNGYFYKLDAVGHTAYLAELKKFKGLQGEKEHPALAASAHWAAAAIRGLDTTSIQSTDLPRLELFATKTDLSPDAFVEVRNANGAAERMTQAQARAFVIQQKEISRAAMQAAGRSPEEIALVLNTGEKFAMGQAADDVLLMGKVDYTRAESVRLRYKQYGADDVDLAARTAAGLATRIEIEYGVRQKTADDVMHGFGLNELAERLPQERMDLIKDLSETDPRAGLITAAHSRFGSLREWAASVGAMANKGKDSLRINTEEQMHGFFEHFSKSENFGQRSELALFVNAARTNDYYVFPLNDGNGTLALRKDKFEQLVREQLPANYDELGAAEQKAAAMAAESALKQARMGARSEAEKLIAARNGDAYILSKEVGEVVQWHMGRNTAYIANDKAIAEAYGKYVTRDPNVFYAPPPSLQRMQFVAFAVPKDGSATDAPRFMLYAQTQAELEAKIAYVAENHKMYGVVRQSDVSSYKKLIGEYDKGRVFDELEFDANLRSTGRSGNLTPNLDVYGVETLDRIRNWHHRKAEHQFMSALELKYADTVQTLRSTDRVIRGQGIDTKEASTIYADTVNQILDKASEGGLFHQLYQKVQDVFNVYGSKALDTAGNKLVELWRARPTSTAASARFDVEAFEAVTRELDAKGFQNPYKDIESYLANSGSITDNRTAAALSRVASTLVAGLTLRLDWLNSVVQVMSTPILLSGVIREAKLSTADKRLVDMSTVANPANGVREPTAAKLMQRAMQQVFTPEGKALAEEARKRGILQDYTRQYLEASDFSSLNGRHTLQMLQQKIDDGITFASKITGHMLAEDFSRALVMNAMWDIAKQARLSDDAAWAMVRSGVDKVHGIYRAHSRVQLFNGTIGQSMGLFQTYMFNMAQNVGRAIQDGRGRDAFVMAVMQGSIFGGRSLPMFSTLNNMVADTNSGKLDIYSLAGTDYDPNGMGSYFLYGLGSYATVVPTDAYSRGDIALRHSTVVPLNPLDWPAVAMISKAVGNIVDMGKAIDNGADVGNALAYGLAHNALNRPLQGVGVYLQNAMTSTKGSPLFTDANYTDYNPEAGFNFAALGARLLGGKPLAEAIALDSYYRRTAYQTEQRNELNELAKQFRISSLDGTSMSEEAMTEFLSEYASRGGNPENFNAWAGRQLMNASQGTVDVFKQGMQETAAGRLYGSLMYDRRTVPLWEDDNIIANGQ